jgi:hypothetical protein
MQYPAGHLSHLTENQQKNLDAFKQICLEQNYYTPASGGKAASHDDETLLYAKIKALGAHGGALTA